MPYSPVNDFTSAKVGARKAGLLTRLGCHSFRATGITDYLLNGGLLEYAQQMAAHESARTTKLYDRRNDQVTLDQVERNIPASALAPASSARFCSASHSTNSAGHRTSPPGW